MLPRIVIVGCGRMGSVHLELCSNLGVGTLCGAVDPIARTVAMPPSCKRWSTVEEMLEVDRPDVAVVATPTDTHTAVVRELLGGGVHVLCEKPCGSSTADIQMLGGLAARNSLCLAFGYWRRFVPELISLRDDIQSGRLGKLLQIWCAQWDSERPAEAFLSSCGGEFIDMGVHEFDQLSWLTGLQFECMSSVGPRKSTDESSCSTAVLAAGDVSAIVSLGRRFPDSDACWIEVIGSGAHRRIQFVYGAESDVQFRSAVRQQDKAFVESIAHGEPQWPLAGWTDAIQALRTAKVSDRALRASG